MAHGRMVRGAAVGTPDVDWDKINATTEEDIRRQQAEDGEDLDAPPTGYRLVTLAGRVRKALDLTQQAFADLIGVPVGTVRNWEQGRVKPDPAARALLLILWREPKAALRALKVVAA